MDFWSSFWPSAVATLVGVAAAIPIGLWLNRVAERRGNQAQAHADANLLANGLRAIRSALAHNIEQLGVLLDAIEKKQALFELKVDTAAWDSARDHIVPLLRDPEFLRRVAYHFSRVSSMARLTAQYLEMNIGISTTVEGMAPVRSALKNHLAKDADEVRDDARGLSAEIDEELASLERVDD